MRVTEFGPMKKTVFDSHEFDFPQTRPTESERKKMNLPPFSTWFEPRLPKLGLVTKMHKEGKLRFLAR